MIQEINQNCLSRKNNRNVKSIKKKKKKNNEFLQ